MEVELNLKTVDRCVKFNSKFKFDKNSKTQLIQQVLTCSALHDT